MREGERRFRVKPQWHCEGVVRPVKHGEITFKLFRVINSKAQISLDRLGEVAKDRRLYFRTVDY